jgi:uncharacterized protein YidB (DUF937 family)
LQIRKILLLQHRRTIMASLGKVALAMLGILAYQNRDKLGTLLRGKYQSGLHPNDPQMADGGGLLEQMMDHVGSGGGLGDILERFRNAGSRVEVDSWVRQGPNKPIDALQIQAAIDPQTLDELSGQTGLSREELLDRIAKDLPEAVDQMTPNGRLPGDEEGDPSASPTLLDEAPTERTRK